MKTWHLLRSPVWHPRQSRYRMLSMNSLIACFSLNVFTRPVRFCNSSIRNMPRTHRHCYCKERATFVRMWISFSWLLTVRNEHWSVWSIISIRSVSCEHSWNPYFWLSCHNRTAFLNNSWDYADFRTPPAFSTRGSCSNMFVFSPEKKCSQYLLCKVFSYAVPALCRIYSL